MGSAPAQIPTSFSHELRACLRCHLVKTYDQSRQSGCENCPSLRWMKITSMLSIVQLLVLMG
ncbi:hypothetical protein Pint_33280 [Pistacia integerrima]|uniref:Uncharacterized protein n=1 Tax=Pistacia integerrima TaxID=434235 RepID=A0ACC0X2U6_9ROSI|nr:hypothetical protein Pint_33280 [Pistacia integerrima]